MKRPLQSSEVDPEILDHGALAWSMLTGDSESTQSDYQSLATRTLLDHGNRNCRSLTGFRGMLNRIAKNVQNPPTRNQLSAESRQNPVLGTERGVGTLGG
jgi:hypothetical protein